MGLTLQSRVSILILHDTESRRDTRRSYSSSSSSLFFGFFVFLPPCFDVLFLKLSTQNSNRSVYFCFGLSSTLTSFIFFLATLRLSSLPCVESVSCKYSLTIKLNTIDVQTIKVKKKRYPLYHGGANRQRIFIARNYPIRYG